MLEARSRLGLAAVVIANLVAATPGAALAGGDAAAGQAKSVACQACHISVNAKSEIPHLVGQRAGYIRSQLKAFKAGDRKNDLMHAIAAQLSDADIDDQAAYWSGLPAGSDSSVPPAAAAIKQTAMAFPREFPKGFVVYHSENDAEHKLIARAYINAVGLAAAKAGKPLPDGTVIMQASYAAKLDAAGQPVVDKDGSWVADKPVSFSGMEARAGWGKDLPDLLRNANWQYAVFALDKTVNAEVNQAVCLACHKPKADTSYVFGWDNIVAKAKAK